MTEAIFPLLGVAFVMLVVLPASALAARLVLGVLARRSGGPLHGLNARLVVLIGSAMVPIAWLLSAGLHQAETGRSIVACLLHRADAADCLEPGLFAITLGAVLALCCGRLLMGRSRQPASSSERARAVRRRVDALMAGDGQLAWLRGRLQITDADAFAVAATGLFRPSIVVGAAYAETLDDGALAAALAHEAEHVRSRDPLRYLLLQLALAANPLGAWLLSSEAASWLRAREAHCDREAVLGGAAPLSLATAIVAAARPAAHTAALGAPDASVLRFRVQLLCAFAESPPKRCCRRPLPVFATSVALLLFALTLPHRAGTQALDVLHFGAERAATYFWP